MDFLVALIQELLLLFRNGVELAYECLILMVLNSPPCFGDSQGEHGEHGDLPGECLGGSHTDFRSHMDVGASVGGSWDGRSDGVADTEDKSPPFLCELHSGERVSRLSRLGDGDDHVAVVDHRVAISELRGILHFHWNLAEILNELFSNKSGMPARSACHNDEAPGIDKLFPVVDHSR